MTKVLVVSDSSSLIIAAKAELLDCLCDEFIVEIPKKVFEETVTAGRKLQKLDALKIEKLIVEKKIAVKKVKPVKNKKISGLLGQFNLDEGEKEAIELYIQTKAELLLVDDKHAINAAKLLGINWSGIPAIIVVFAENGIIEKTRALESLRIAQEEGRYKLDFILDAFNKIQQLKGGKL